MSAAWHKPVILTYHSISSGSSPLEIPPEIFAAQMDWLKANARVAPLREVVAALKQQQSLPERTAVLTFDDGYLDFYQHAAPVLSRLGLPAIVFLPTIHVGGANRWWDAYLAEKPLMNWQQVRQLVEKGVEFGSHSETHANLTKLFGIEVTAELSGSNVAIEVHAGCAAEFFCYPYGRWNRNVRQAVAELYEGACSTGAGVVEQDADPFALPRVDAHYVRDLNTFRTLFTRQFERYVFIRRMIRKLRAAPEGDYARLARGKS